ncbi:tubby-like F-box protein 3 [Impatiens glandulifera]|uniref:tubby-like F-box protein 3 n=1 Tax=Impatiens glandulifera TaxID=253017 RepID=UPI001FB07EB6|nr:tubby-like F-box protein 3 [Impatiens glandulifera]
MSKMGMKSESGRHSKRGFSLRSRSLRAFEEIPVTLREDGLKESSWANIPPEILREVLKKIESSQTTWPLRQNVVSCAGVCKGWRDMMKDCFKLTIYVYENRGPRSMQCTMNSIPASSIEPRGVAPFQTEFPRTNFESYPSPLPFFRSKSTRTEAIQSEKEKMLFMKNKSPKWHDRLQCWCLNFNGRVTVASVKNFQLVAYSEGDGDGEGEGGGVEHEDVILQFGKVGKDLFTMDYQYPISAFQAFAICISSFETMIACE